MLILRILVLICLLTIALQDFKYRSIAWIWFPICFVVLFIVGTIETGINKIVLDLSLNLIVVSIIFIAMCLYYSVRNKKVTFIINAYFGLGDLLFFILLCTAFSPINLVLFLLISCLATLVITGLILLRKHKNTPIPLAGAQAALLIFVFVCDNFIDAFEPLSDDYALKLMEKLIF